MSTGTTAEASEMAIFRRIVDHEQAVFSEAAARDILRLDFGSSDRERMNELAAKNREGKLSAREEEELDNYIRVGQTLGILRSKARRALKRSREPRAHKQGKS
jgi:hypothetical protein